MDYKNLPQKATPAPRKKLIEVALPLEAINKAAAREKSIRHGHPSTLHLWWARRPLAACRAVLFASLVDDPGAVPEEFPTDADQLRERERLFRLIEQLVLWENSNNETVLNAARQEIARSVARSKGLTLPVSDHGIQRFLIEHAPPVLDPFCSGGSIPLEAQRLGLRAYGSDLNPVAVLITKALIEIPPQFAGQPPVNPKDRAGMARNVNWPGASGLAADVRYYGQWMRDEAQKRIGCLYPKVALPKEHGGGEATVIAWLWARTVKCPNPACGAQMPLVRSFALSTKKGKEAWVEPQVDQAAKTVRFAVRTGQQTSGQKEVSSRGSGFANEKGKKVKATFQCVVCHSGVVKGEYIDQQADTGLMSTMPLAVVAEGSHGRTYLPFDDHQVRVALEDAPKKAQSDAFREKFPTEPARGTFASNAQGRIYGFKIFSDYFTPRQLVALTTFSDLVAEARERVLPDAAGRNGAQARADAVATYLAFAVDKGTDYWSSMCSWHSSGEKMRNTFGRQAIAMVWDYAECNPFSTSTGNWEACIDWVWKVVRETPASAVGSVSQRDAVDEIEAASGPVISTDPPYYDNIGYADLSDFFYVWLRRSLRRLYPDLFSTLLVPKKQELIAAPYRFTDSDEGTRKEQAQRFFEKGLGEAFSRMRAAQAPGYPLTVYYAFKQSEAAGDDDEESVGVGVSSTGWETMLEGLLGAGFSIGGTWPMRSELGNRMIASGTNALASSIVLVCRPRPADAPVATRGEFLATLRRELPEALRKLQQGSIAPVDLNQAAIGPGMAIFTRYKQVVDAKGSPIAVRAALQAINQEVESYLAGQEGELDEDSRFCLAWFRQFGMGSGRFGEADVMARAMNTSVQRLHESGVLVSGGGQVRLLGYSEYKAEWDPRADPRVNDWKGLHQLIGALYNDDARLGGETGAGRVLKLLGADRAERARDLAYRLFAICERKNWTAEAQAYNGLAASWLAIQARAAERGPLEQGVLA